MKLAAAEALAALAREDVPDEVVAAYQGNRPRFGPRYIIPVPFDPRLISAIPPAVAKAAMDTGVARRPIADMEAYRHQLSARRDPIAGTLQQITARVRQNPQRIVFAEGEEEAVIRAAVSFANQRFGTPILVGREDLVKRARRRPGIELKDGIEIMNARLSTRRDVYTDYLYKRLQRNGYLHPRLRAAHQHRPQPLRRLHGGARRRRRARHRHHAQLLDGACRISAAASTPKPGHCVIGVSIALCRGRTVVVADTAVHDMPNSEELADIAEEAAGVARRLGFDPRVAMLAYSTFGNPAGERAEKVREAVRILDSRRVDFEYDGEMGADVALKPTVMASYPFCRLSGAGERAGHAGAPLRGDLDQHAAGARRLDRARAAARRLRRAGADPADLRARLRHRQHGGARGVQYQRVRASAYDFPVVIPDGAARASPGPIACDA